MAKTATRTVELEPIDRLEEKIKLLVGMVDRMKADQARAEERDLIRNRVTDMLEQLEALNL